jgi:hypothetical protein
MRSRPLLLILAALLSGACASKDPASQPSPLTFEPRRFEKSLPGCGDAEKRDEPCVTFRVEWPEVTKAPSPDVQTRINAALLAALQPNEAPRGFETEAAQSIADFQRLHREFPDTAITYFDRRTADILLSNSAFLSIEISSEEFHGGAHPNSQREYLNFLPATGQRAQLSSLLESGAHPKLLALVERAFRSERAIPEGQSLTQAGFLFEQDKFTLPAQWGAGPRGLIFFYNAYEVAPYSLGPTQVIVPYSQLKGILRTGLGLPIPK